MKCLTMLPKEALKYIHFLNNEEKKLLELPIQYKWGILIREEIWNKNKISFSYIFEHSKPRAIKQNYNFYKSGNHFLLKEATKENVEKAINSFKNNS